VITHRIAPAVLAVALLAVFALPVAAQSHCDEPLPGEPRAGFSCTPAAGGGEYTQTTCTFYGDIAWLIEVMSDISGEQIPAGTCGVVITFADADWYTEPGWSLYPVSDDIVAIPCFLNIDQEPDVSWLASCTTGIPATSTGGLVTLILALAALGGLILWRRTL